LAKKKEKMSHSSANESTWHAFSLVHNIEAKEFDATLFWREEGGESSSRVKIEETSTFRVRKPASSNKPFTQLITDQIELVIAGDDKIYPPTVRTNTRRIRKDGTMAYYFVCSHRRKHSEEVLKGIKSRRRQERLSYMKGM
jgi:hypothetical protein